MQQRPKDRTSRSVRARRTQPSLPVSTLPTAPTVVPAQQSRSLLQAPVKKRFQLSSRAAWKLCALGLSLALIYFAFYPLLAGAIVRRNAEQQALLSIFPWLPRLYWTIWAPFLAQGASDIPIFNLKSSSPAAYANLLLVLLGLAFLLLLISVRIGSRVAKERLALQDMRLIFGMLFTFTVVFSIIFAFAPAVLTQEVFSYSSFGRMVAVDHLNPYVQQVALAGGAKEAAPYGPVWLDLTLPVVLLTHGSVPGSVVGLRFLGLVAHLVNAALIWAILAKLKPQARISGVLLYAWNPLVLLVGVGEMHYDIVVVTLVLLAVFLFQRDSWIVSWVFLLLAALINALCLLLFPLFLRLLWKESRIMGPGRRFLWWLLVACISGAIVALAYFPYRQGWSITGILGSIGRTFVQDQAANSFNAVIWHLPSASSPALAWIVVPQHWSILAAVAVGGLLLVGLWLADTLSLVLVCASWVFLALFALLPTNWPWFMLLPLSLAIVSTGRSTIMLAVLLTMGAALEYYFLLWPTPWQSHALITVGVPLLVWGWTLFFTSTWQMAHPEQEEQPVKPPAGGFSFSRPSWSSRPSWPHRR